MALHLTGAEYADDHPSGDRMSSEEFRVRLIQAGHGVQSFARFSGANPRTVRRWHDGEQDIPPYVPKMLELIRTLIAVQPHLDSLVAQDSPDPDVARYDIEMRLMVRRTLGLDA